MSTVLSIFARYRQQGGEERVFDSEADLLERNGWRVVRVAPPASPQSTLRERFALGREAVWSRVWRNRIRDLIERERPDVVHIHNTFPTLSPSVLSACREAGVPVVKTLHNYRLLCAAATLWRDHRPCRDCVGRAPWPALRHRCYHDSLAESAVVAGSLALHRALGSWSRGVDLFVCPSHATRGIFLEAGLPPERLVVKPNFVAPDPGAAAGPGEYALFAGRLCEEKGIAELVAAWENLDVPLRILGDGPLAATVLDLASRHPGVETDGWKPHSEVFAALRRARFLVFSSRAGEACPMIVLEAFACGVPVVAANGAVARELIGDDALGWLYPGGDSAALEATAHCAWADPEAARERGRRARHAYEALYDSAQGYRRLTECYELARELAAGRALRRRTAS